MSCGDSERQSFYISSYSQFAEEAVLKTLWREKKKTTQKLVGIEGKLFKKRIDCQKKIEVIEGWFRFSEYYHNLILQAGTYKGM